MNKYLSKLCSLLERVKCLSNLSPPSSYLPPAYIPFYAASYFKLGISMVSLIDLSKQLPPRSGLFTGVFVERFSNFNKIVWHKKTTKNLHALNVGLNR